MAARERVQCESVDGLVFDAEYDSGGLGHVKAHGDGTFALWTRADCEGSWCATRWRSWFSFSVRGATSGQVLRFEVHNMNTRVRLLEHGFCPVWRSLPSQPEWRRVEQPARAEMENGSPDTFVVRFSHEVVTPAGETLFFAFCFPHGYVDCMARLGWVDALLAAPSGEADAALLLAEECDAEALEQAAYAAALGDVDDAQPAHVALTAELLARAAAKATASLLPAQRGAGIYYRRELLTRSQQGRRIDLLTITARRGAGVELEAPLEAPLLPGTGERPAVFPGRPVVLVTARVHPGETPASHVFDGLLELLLRADDPRAAALREAYVFKLIPMLNPDGVAAGHYRADASGLDLNRTYEQPSAADQPSIFAAMAVVRQLAARGTLRLYVDLHAHANKRGAFFYANALPSEEERQAAALYAHLVALNTRWLDLSGCSWRDAAVHKGSGRSAVFMASRCPLVFTLECNYDGASSVNELPPRHGAGDVGSGRLSPDESADEGASANTGASPKVTQQTTPKFTPQRWQEVGRALGLAALDMAAANPASRLGALADGGLQAGLERARKAASWFGEYAENEEDDDG